MELNFNGKTPGQAEQDNFQKIVNGVMKGIAEDKDGQAQANRAVVDAFNKLK